jgi:hypothetical protein
MADGRSVRTRRGELKPDLMTVEEKVSVTSVYGGEERNRQEKLKVRKFLVEPAYVRVNAGMTKNMGNYESLRIDVSITVPCYTEEIDKVFPAVADKVSIFLEEELKQYE